MDDNGFYNKYLFNNNSYLIKHIVWSTVKNNKNNINLNKVIEKELKNKNINYPKSIPKKYTISKLLRQKSRENRFCNITTNTETIIKINKSTNTEPVKQVDINIGSLSNRLNNYKN